MRRPSLIALIAITVLFAGAALPAQAANPVGEDGVMVILIDEGASPVQGDLDVSETVALTMARGTSAGTIAAASYGVETNEIVTAESGPDGIRLVNDVINSVRGIEMGPSLSDQFVALSDTFSFLSRVDAAKGSRVVLVTSGRILGESANTRERLASVADLYAAEGWMIDVITLPSTKPVLRELMSGLSVGSTGVFYDAGSASGIASVFEKYSQLTLENAMDVEMRDNSAAIVNLDIAPHTERFTTVFVRRHEMVDVSVFSPNGTKASADMENVDIRITPSAVIVEIASPVPGNWTLQGTGPASKLVAEVDIDNPLELRLIEQPPLPVGEIAVIEAAAFNGESAQLMSGAEITATIANADGTTEVVALNDAGLSGDRFASDGIYSVQLSAPKSQGINHVALKLSWSDYAATMRSQTAFRSETFPIINLTEVKDVEVSAGEIVTVARVQVLVGDYPYLTTPDAIRAILTGVEGTLEAILIPVDEPEPGLSWEFDIAAIIPESGPYEVEVFLDSVFAGRPFARKTPIATSVATVIVEPDTVFGMPVWAITALGVLLVLVAGSMIWVMRKTSPFGYIVDDAGRIVVDFKTLNRSLSKRLASKNVVAAAELSGLPFSGGAFQFSGMNVKLIHKRVIGDPSMRVNSRPAGPEVILGEDIWIGVGGRLFTFQRYAQPNSSDTEGSDSVSITSAVISPSD